MTILSLQKHWWPFRISEAAYVQLDIISNIKKLSIWVSHYSDDEARNFVLQFEREICSWLAEKFCSFCRTSCGIENNCQDLKRENLSPPSFFILSKSFLFSFSEKKLHWEMIDVKSCTMPDHKIKSEKSKTKTPFVVFYPLKKTCPRCSNFRPEIFD